MEFELLCRVVFGPGGGGCRQRLGEEGGWRWRQLLKVEIGEEDRSTFVSLLSTLHDKMSKK